MAFLPPILLVLDLSALSGGSQREWIEFSRVGKVYIPQAVYEEMKLLFDRSPDPDLETVSRTFNHFYPTSGWQIVDTSAHHPNLKGSTSQGLTRRSRVGLAAARCAYALSLNFPTHLVVLVTSDQSMLQRIYEIPSTNLCGINGQTLLQWSRTGQRPIPVSQKLQQLRVAMQHHVPGDSGIVGPPRQTSPTRQTTSQSGLYQRHRRQTNVRKAWAPEGTLSQLLSLVVAFGSVAIAVWLLWGLIHNTDWFPGLRQPLDPTGESSSLQP